MRGGYASRAAVTHHARRLRVTRGRHASRVVVTRGGNASRATVMRHTGLKCIMRDLVLLSSVLFSNVVFFFGIFCSNFKFIALFFNVTVHF